MCFCVRRRRETERRRERCAKFEMQTLNYHAFFGKGGRIFEKKREKNHAERTI